MTTVDAGLIRSAWEGRISGCQLGKPVEGFSMRQGQTKLADYLRSVDALPLRDYVPYTEGAGLQQSSCRGFLTRSEPDDDINYSVLALLLLERHGANLDTADVARAWMMLLPVGMTFTAERAAYNVLAQKAQMTFAFGAEPEFDLAECADNPYNQWIGAQIRADVYGWVCPGDPVLAARLARADAELSHTDDGVHGAVFVAACGAAIPVADSLADAVERASAEIPSDSGAAEAIAFGRGLVGHQDPIGALHAEYGDLSPVHTLNNLALVVWALLAHADDYSAAIGEAVTAGWDTDCNGATVGGLWGLSGEIPRAWTKPWNGRVAVTLAGHDVLLLDDLVDRTVAVAERLVS